MEKKETKQTAMDIFPERVTPHQEEPQVGFPGGISKEGTVNPGDAGSISVTTPEAFQWDEMWGWKTVTLLPPTLCRPCIE